MYITSQIYTKSKHINTFYLDINVKSRIKSIWASDLEKCSISLFLVNLSSS